MAAALLLCAVPAIAQSISQAWERAVAAEPGLQAARAQHRAAAERSNQARGALLPQVEGSYNRQKNHREYIQGTGPGPTASERYPSRTAQINITQPLWRPTNWAGWWQAQRSEEQAAYQAQATEQELMSRFVSAWFDVMAARDTVAQAGEQVQATRQQLEVMRRGATLGTHSDVQSAEAQAKHEQAVAEHASAEAELQGKLASLVQLTGPLPGFAPPVLRAELQGRLFAAMEPIGAWVQRIEEHSPAVRAAEKGLAAAREDVRKQMALHSPTVDLVASRSSSNQGSGNSPGQAGYRSTQDSVGVQVNVPLFSGGTTTAKVREAQELATKAEFELDAARRNAQAQAQQAWANAKASASRADAAEHGLRAAQIALRAAQTGGITGLKTPLDELQARQQLAAAHRDAQRARYDRIVALAKLHAAAGTLDDLFIAELEKSLSQAAPTPVAAATRATAPPKRN